MPDRFSHNVDEYPISWPITAPNASSPRSIASSAIAAASNAPVVAVAGLLMLVNLPLTCAVALWHSWSMAADPPEYINAEQIADELGVHVQTVQRYFREQGLPGRKIGKSWTTTRAALDGWLTGAPKATGAIETQTPEPLETK